VLLIGGGLLSLEAGNGLRRAGAISMGFGLLRRDRERFLVLTWQEGGAVCGYGNV